MGQRTVRKRQSQTAVELHRCSACDSHLVQADGWAQAGTGGLWQIWLRCPDCGGRRTGVYGPEEIDRFDEELDRGTRDLVQLLENLERANMEDALQRFQAALHADLILPEDF